MRAALLLLVLFVLAGCGRPLTGPERAYMAGLMGSGFDPAPVRIAQTPLIGLVERRYPERPRTTCRERILPPPEDGVIRVRTAGIALFHRITVRPDYYLPDYVRAPSGRQSLVAAMFFAHEMTHVWQSQNRAVTGYHPLRAFAEHARLEDPYLFDPATTRRFLDYGYEVQASLVEEYVCCRSVDPAGARTARLARLIGQEMDLAPLEAPRAGRPAPGPEIVLPWAEADLAGVCA